MFASLFLITCLSTPGAGEWTPLVLAMPMQRGKQPMDGLWAGQRRRPNGTFAPNMPDGFHGPAPAFAGKWAGEVPSSFRTKNKTSRVTFEFDATGRPVWNGQSFDQAPVNLPSTSYSDRNASVSVTRKLTFVSITPQQICYSVQKNTITGSGGTFLDFSDTIRHTFRAVPGNSNMIQVELYSAKGDQLLGRFPLQRVE